MRDKTQPDACGARMDTLREEGRAREQPNQCNKTLPANLCICPCAHDASRSIALLTDSCYRQCAAHSEIEICGDGGAVKPWAIAANNDEETGAHIQGRRGGCKKNASIDRLHHEHRVLSVPSDLTKHDVN